MSSTPRFGAVVKIEWYAEREYVMLDCGHIVPPSHWSIPVGEKRACSEQCAREIEACDTHWSWTE